MFMAGSARCCSAEEAQTPHSSHWSGEVAAGQRPHSSRWPGGVAAGQTPHSFHWSGEVAAGQTPHSSRWPAEVVAGQTPQHSPRWSGGVAAGQTPHSSHWAGCIYAGKETKVRQRRRSESEYCFAGPKQEFVSRFLYTVSGSLKTIIQPIKTNRSSKKF